MSGVQRAEAADLPDLAAFLAGFHGAESRQVRPDWVRWRFTGHPLAPASGPELWLARRRGNIVGTQAALPVDFEVAGQTLRGIWAIDLMVDPEWRLRGVAPALSAALEAGKPVVAGLGISEPAWKAFRRAGWHDLGRAPVWWRLLGTLPEDFAGRQVALLSRLTRRPMAAIDRLAEALSRCRLELVPEFDERADTIWQAWPRDAWVVARRDRAALAWRFDACPAASAYRRFLLMRKGRPVGYLVLRFDTAEGMRRAVLVDFLAPPKLMGALLIHAIARARAENADVLVCLSTAAQLWLRALGFVRRPGIRMMARVGEVAPDVAECLVSRPWYVTFADSDVDH